MTLMLSQGYTFRPTPKCTSFDPFQKVLFIRPLAKVRSLTVETDTFLDCIDLSTCIKKSFDGTIFYWNSQQYNNVANGNTLKWPMRTLRLLEIFEGSDEQYFLRGVGWSAIWNRTKRLITVRGCSTTPTYRIRERRKDWAPKNTRERRQWMRSYCANNRL